MRQWTWAEIKTEIEDALDLQDEIFITESELLAYGNEGVDICEASIHKLNEDYFLTKDVMTLVSGTAEYAQPTDIYANKVRGLVYSNSGTIYPLKRLNSSTMFEQIANVQSGESYRWLVTNTAGNGPRVVLFPTPAESGAYITRWYIRNAKQITLDADVLDIPECGIQFVKQFVRVRCYEKEGHPNTQDAKQDLASIRNQMIDSLSDMIPDYNNEVEMDLSIYAETN